MEKNITFFLTLLVVFAPISQTDIDKCNLPLGMHNGAIKDEDLTASSSHNPSSVGPQFARLGNESGGGAWCPNSIDTAIFLEVDLHQVHVISAISTQGRYANGQGAEFAREYSLEYFRPSLRKWLPGNQATRFQGNSDTSSIVTNYITPVIFASKIRILPYSIDTTVCIRIELYGCLLDDDLVSYSSPPGDLADSGLTYDGVQVQNDFTEGLGMLVDKDTHNGYVGWRRNSESEGIRKHKDVATFRYSRIKSFRAVEIYYESDEEFGTIVLVSDDGVKFSKVAKHQNFADITVQPGQLRIKLNEAQGRFIKVRLYFFERPWIKISEIYVDQVSVDEEWNPTEADEGNSNDNTESCYCSKILFYSVVAAIIVLILFLIGAGIWFKIFKKDEIKNNGGFVPTDEIELHNPQSQERALFSQNNIDYAVPIPKRKNRIN